MKRYGSIYPRPSSHLENEEKEAFSFFAAQTCCKKTPLTYPSPFVEEQGYERVNDLTYALGCHAASGEIYTLFTLIPFHLNSIIREAGNAMLQPHNTKGKLIIVEGIDGSGKSTQIDLLYKWLKAQGKSVFFSEWNSSALVKSTTRLAKKEKAFTPTTFSLLQATDFADRWENQMLPMLKAGVIVLADRYAFTAFARDVARGVHPEWVRNLYSFAPQPDLMFYFQVPVNIAVDRILSGRAKLKYYEAGMDLGLSENKVTSFRLFQQRIVNEYDAMVPEFGLTVVDGTLPVQVQQDMIRQKVKNLIRGWRGLPNPQARSIQARTRHNRNHPVSQPRQAETSEVSS